MTVSGWRYYNHAAIPACAPHETPDLSPLSDGSIWKIGEGTVFFARWTSGWDLDHETGWWYVIKDTPFDLAEPKSSHRAKIKKGIKNFDVRIIEPGDYLSDLYRATVKAYSGWPKKYRPSETEEQFVRNMEEAENIKVFGAFSREDGVLYGYAVVEEYESYAAGSVLRTDPDEERLGINAAVMYAILEYYNDRLHDGYYFCDGERSIRHETRFQEYLEKYFDFRKAYCTLNLRYRPGTGFLVKALYPFRKLIKGKTALGSRIAGVLRMEATRREQ